MFETDKKFNDATARADINDHNYYHNYYIYKFINKLTGELLYIGSTNLDIMSRIGNHKHYIRHPEKNEDNKQLYYILKDIKIKNIEFFVMNKIECENDEELHEIENQYIKFYNPKLNTTRTEPKEEYKNEDLIDINIIINRKKFPSIRYMCKCGLYYIRGAITTHNKKDEHQLYISKLNVIHLEQKIYYKNKNYEIIYDDHEIMENCKNEINIRARINYKKNVVDMVCECGAPLKNKNSYNKHITSDKHKNNMEIKYGN